MSIPINWHLLQFNAPQLQFLSPLYVLKWFRRRPGSLSSYKEFPCFRQVNFHAVVLGPFNKGYKDRTSISDSSKPTFASIGKLIAISSAHLTRSFLLVFTAFISLIKLENNTGPRTVPRGTPLFIETYLVR